jgi:hypothetical protein
MRASSGAQQVPRLDGSTVLGSMRELRRDYLGTLSRAAREVGPLARITAGPPGWRVIVYSVSSPELAAEILSQPDASARTDPAIASCVERWARTCSPLKMRAGTGSVASWRQFSPGAASPVTTSTS